MSAFLELFSAVPRQGPGLAKDVAWAVAQAGSECALSVCDAGCGNGGDTAALLAAMPEAQVVACDKDATLLKAAGARHFGVPRLRVGTGDLAALEALPEAPFDFIWCAGAIYFLGTVKGLRGFRKALKPGGVVAFSAPVYFSPPSPEAQGFWMDVPVPDEAELRAQVAEAGFELIADRPLSNAAWAALYMPLKKEISRRRAEGADAEMEGVMAAMEQEMARWARVKRETGYQLVVARLA